jgi:arabinogalactan endo-1,4-beta-galactosidase
MISGFHQMIPAMAGIILLSVSGSSSCSADVVVGADLSFVPRLESLGVEYRVDGQPGNALQIFQDHSFSHVRLRLWHTPDEPWHGLDSTVAFARRAVLAGHEVLLDFHYSDTWADPGHQSKPAAWAGLSFPSLVDSVYAYTNRVILRFRDEGALPALVQLGNETSSGFLWDDGRVGGSWDTPEQWTQFAQLLSAARSAVLDSLPPEPEPKIVLHFADGGNNAGCRWFLDNVILYGVDFDVIGLSFYPWWHGTLTDLEANLADLATRYGKEIQVVEASYPWTLEEYDEVGNFVTEPWQLHSGYPATPEGQLDYLTDLLGVVAETPGGLGTALYYWEPAWISVPGGAPNPHENLTVFDFDGDALPGLAFPLSGVSAVGDSPAEGRGTPAGRPNPFREETEFFYSVPEGGTRVRIEVFDVSGRRVRILRNGRQSGGPHRGAWDGRDQVGRTLPAGVYFCRLAIGDGAETRKLVLLP